MNKLFVTSQYAVKPGMRGFTKKDIEDHIDRTKVVERDIEFSASYLYEAKDEKDAVEKMSHTVFGRDFTVSAREFTDEEYKKAFEKSPHRKLEWLADALGLTIYDAENLFGKLSNSRLADVVRTIAGRTIPEVKYR
jgi:hypothetical protein